MHQNQQVGKWNHKWVQIQADKIIQNESWKEIQDLILSVPLPQVRLTMPTLLQTDACLYPHQITHSNPSVWVLYSWQFFPTVQAKFVLLSFKTVTFTLECSLSFGLLYIWRLKNKGEKHHQGWRITYEIFSLCKLRPGEIFLHIYIPECWNTFQHFAPCLRVFYISTALLEARIQASWKYGFT